VTEESRGREVVPSTTGKKAREISRHCERNGDPDGQGGASHGGCQGEAR
jgi:hypothetical protein